MISFIIESYSYCFSWLMIFIVSIPVTSFEFEYSKQAISENNGISELPSLVVEIVEIVQSSFNTRALNALVMV